jgi:hypothetical protein
MRTRSLQRRGGVYVFVLATAMLTTIIGLMVLTTAQINGRANAGTNDSMEAAVLAQSAVEYGLNTVANDSNWRNDYANNAIVTPYISLGRGSITFKLTDDVNAKAADLTNTADAVRVYGIATINNTARVYSVRGTQGSPLACLKNNITAGAMNLGTANIIGTPTLYSNTSITGGLAVLTGAILDATLSINLGSLLNLTVNTGVVAEALPDTVHAFDYYNQNGTTISIGSIPSVSGNPTIQNQVLGPTTNKLGGGTNPKGIYIIDCKNENLVIQNFRMYGTLVILNPGPSSIIQSSVYFSPVTAGYPCLMVSGNWNIATTATNLADSSSSLTNYNPAGEPYMGTADTTYTTSYPCRFDGIVYVSGNLTTSNTFSNQGTVIVNGSWTPAGTANLTYDPTSYNNPPPGFTSGKLIPVSGTWRWEPAQ